MTSPSSGTPAAVSCVVPMPIWCSSVRNRSAGETGRFAGNSARRSLSHYLSDFQSPTRDERRVTLLPVIAAGFRVDFGRAAEFPHRDNDRFAQQAALIQIVEQRGRGLVEHPGVTILKLLKVPIVHVPPAVAGVFDGLDMRTPIHLHEPHARFHQPPRHQTTLAKAKPAVA